MLLILVAAVESHRPALPNDLLHMYYGELNVCALRDGVTPKVLVAVPLPGEAVLDPRAVSEAPEMQFVVVDGELLTVTVRSSSGHLPPFRVSISPAEAEEDAEAVALFSVASQHSLSKSRIEFDVRPSLQLRFMHDSCQQFIRLDTFSRRLSTFTYDLPKYIAVTSTGVDVLYIPHNTSMGIRFRVNLAITDRAWKMRVTVLRKPPIPPVLVRVYMKLSNTSRGEYLLGSLNDEAPGPRGAVFDDAFAAVPASQMESMIVKRPEIVFVIRADFEELHRSCYEEFKLVNYMEEMKTLTEYHQMEKVLYPTSAADKSFAPRHCTADGHRGTKDSPTRPSDLMRLRLFFSGHTQSVAFHIVQPFPVSNLQIHAVDIANDTMFFEEEHYVPYVSMHDTESAPFGWHYVLDKDATWVRGDALTIHLFFDMHRLPATDHAIAGGASAILHPGIRSRVTMQDRHDSLVRWVERHGGTFAGTIGVNHQQQKCFLQVPEEKASKGTVAVALPRELLFSEVHARAIPFIRELFNSEPWAEFVEDQQVMTARDAKVLLLTLFSLTQAESPSEGTKWHLFLSTLPTVGPNGLINGFALNVVRHDAFVADTLELNQLRWAADLVRKRHLLLHDMYKFVSSQWPWLVADTTQPAVDKEHFFERFAALDSVAVLSANDVLFVPPLIHECTFSDIPGTELLYNTQNETVELRFSRKSLVRGQAAAGFVEVTCDLFQAGPRESALNSADSFVRRGFVPLRAASVVDVSLREVMLEATLPIPLGEDTFLLTKSKPSRDALLSRLSDFMGECRSSSHSRYSPQCLRLFRQIVERRLREFPGSSLSQRVAIRSDSDRLVASHVSAIVARLVRSARDVLLTHLDFLTDEGIAESHSTEFENGRPEPTTSRAAEL